MPPVQLNPVASTFLVAFYILTALLLVVLLGMVVFLIVKLNALLEEYRQKVDPLLAKIDTVLTVTSEKVTTIGAKAEEILTQGEEITEMVHSRVDTTTYAVQRTVFTPLIGVNSLIAGLKRGAETFASRQQKSLTEAVRAEPPTVSVAKADATMAAETVPEVQTVEVLPLLPLEEKNINQTVNQNPVYSVNTVVSNGTQPQQIVIGSRKE